MNTQKVCLDKQNMGECTKGSDCPVCSSNVNELSQKMENTNLLDSGINLNLNTNAKVWVPKSKREVQEGKNETTLSSSTNGLSSTSEKLNLNLSAKEYVPGNYQNQEVEAEPEEEGEEEDEAEEFDMIMKDIINNEALEEMEEDDESDEDKWFPKYKDCECCKGFVYKCNGVACANMDACYCKVKDECDEEQA